MALRKRRGRLTELRPDRLEKKKYLSMIFDFSQRRDEERCIEKILKSLEEGRAAE